MGTEAVQAGPGSCHRYGSLDEAWDFFRDNPHQTHCHWFDESGHLWQMDSEGALVEVTDREVLAHERRVHGLSGDQRWGSFFAGLLLAMVAWAAANAAYRMYEAWQVIG